MNGFKNAWRTCSILAVLAMVGGAPLESDVIEIAEAMLQADGEDYIAARDRVLAMSQEELDRAVEYLQRDRDDPVAELLGLALRFRAQHPERGSEFEHELEWMIDSAVPTRAAHVLSYPSRVPREASERDALYFEALIKYDLPVDAKVRIHGILCNAGRRDHPVVVQGHLAVLFSSLPSQVKGRSSIPLAEAAAMHPDERVVLALVRLYRELRVSEAGGASAPGAALGYLSTPEALLALEQLLEFERSMAEQENHAPWDDAPIQALLQQTRDLQKEAGEAVRHAKSEGRDHTAVQAEYEVRLQKLLERIQSRRRWERLETSRDVILKKLSVSP